MKRLLLLLLHGWPCSCLFIMTLVFFLPLCSLSISLNTLTPNQLLRDGDTLVSPLGVFELGFFTPNGSTNRYVGIWYKHIPVFTVVWVANRNHPLTDSFSSLKLSITGNLTITNSTGFSVWFSNSSTTSLNPIVQLLDSGNFIVRNASDQESYQERRSIVWQSFDYPTNTWLEGMKLSSKLNNLGFTSWKDPTDPSVGDHSFSLDPQGLQEIVLREGSLTKWRLGSWNGLSLTGAPGEQSKFNYFSDESESYFTRKGHSDDHAIINMQVLDQSGLILHMQWGNRTQSWEVIKRLPKDKCDGYGKCGDYGVCNSEWPPAALCECLVGFRPRFPDNWKMGDWSDGCVRKTDLADCHNGIESSTSSSDWFLNVGNMKPPDSSNNLAVVDRGLSFEECKHACLKNCSCVAFGSERIDREDGGGCVLWVGQLLDLRQFNNVGQAFHIRLAASDELGDQSQNFNATTSKKKLIIGIISAAAAAISFVSAIFLCTCYCFMRLKNLTHNGFYHGETRKNIETVIGNKSMDLPNFTYASIVSATNNFSVPDKLGEGGFGPVYKGCLPDGQQVAIKRLSNCSKQGEEEFMNEAMLIARLQHTNLVRLIGVCSHREERMLIYEFMPNKSLDSILFDPTKVELLNWPRRKRIIEGIAQGLLYLHKYSRLKIIHRDLKAGNILLDVDWNPKISDFGLAKIFSGNHNQEKTNRVVGTYGYMSPEYAFLGRFSEKSDVFSFGVMILEIVSGKKNSSFHHSDGPCHLIQYAWDLWRNGSAMQLLDKYLVDVSPCDEEMFVCIEIGLLCVQEAAEDRPSMPVIVSLLENNGARIPTPKQPAFYLGSKVKLEMDMSRIPLGSSNDVTISSLDAR